MSALTKNSAPPRLAVSAKEFAVVDDEDFGFALYATREWRQDGQGVVRGCGNDKAMTLVRLVADRMGLPPAVPVAHRDDDPLNCRRHNVYSTAYVWKRGTFVRKSVETVYKTVGRGKNKKEVPEDIEHANEEAGWLYGNVAVFQSATGKGRSGSGWTLIHLPTGRSMGCSWDKIDDAKLGVELIHAEGNLAELPDDGKSFTEAQGKKWRELCHRRRGNW